MGGGLKSLLAMALVITAAWAAFAHATRNFQTVTSDGARRADLAASPAPLPDIMLIDQSGRTFPLSRLNDGGSSVTLLTFMYTRCRTVCRASAAGHVRLAGQLGTTGQASQLQLLSISFDPWHDTPEVLQRHAATLRADPAVWRLATVQRPSDLPLLLQHFGVIVLPDGLGGYSHNAALFLIDRRDRLAGAYAMDSWPGIALALGLPT